jgi:hypothetical protein
MLRRGSQRLNIKLRDLAKQVASQEPGSPPPP